MIPKRNEETMMKFYSPDHFHRLLTTPQMDRQDASKKNLGQRKWSLRLLGLALVDQSHFG